MTEDRAANVEARPARRSTSGDWLVRRGGWVLLSVGVALLVLAAVFASKEAIAAIFALGCVALVIVGVMLPRVHGPFEFSASRALSAYLNSMEKILNRRRRSSGRCPASPGRLSSFH
jgi:hypothetical protein